MTGSLVDMFPPEMQTIYGVIAGIAAVVGLAVWAAGIKIARASLAVISGVVVAGICALSLPGPTHISPFTGAIIGFVAGVLAGAVTFRFLQGLIVAVCLALLAGGIYYRVQVVRPAGEAPAATMRAEQMLIPLDRLGQAAGVKDAKNGNDAPAGRTVGRFDVANVVSAVQGAASDVRRAVSRRWEAIDAVHRQRITALAGVTALAALLLSIFFPRHTTWIVSAAMGTFLLLVAVIGLVQVFAPQYQIYFPTALVARWAVAAIVMLAGMLTQRWLFWASPKSEPKADPAQMTPG